MRPFAILFIAASAAGGAGAAEDVARVLSSTPVMQTVAVPRQSCSVQPVAVAPARSGAGAVLGAIAGGAAGNAIGSGSGRAVATVIGLIGGAVLGDSIEGAGGPQVQPMQQCTTQTYYENRAVAYNVVYEYAGRQYAVQMPSDPGPTVRLQITPVGNAAPPPVYAPPVYAPPAVPQAMVAPAVYYAPPVVAAPTYRYPPIGIQFHIGIGGGHRHWH